MGATARLTIVLSSYDGFVEVDHSAGPLTLRAPTNVAWMPVPSMSTTGWGSRVRNDTSRHIVPPRGPGAARLLAAVEVVALDRAFPPDLSRLDTPGTTIRDTSGEVLALRPTPGGVWRFRTPAEDVPPFLMHLLVAVEDRRFHEHSGVDPLAAARALGQAARAAIRVTAGKPTPWSPAPPGPPRGLACRPASSPRRATGRAGPDGPSGSWSRPRRRSASWSRSGPSSRSPSAP